MAGSGNPWKTLSNAGEPGRNKVWHIKALELQAVFLISYNFSPDFLDRTFRFTPIILAQQIFNHKRGTGLPQSCRIAWELLLLCIQHEIIIQAIHFPGVHNVVTDALSCSKVVHHLPISIDGMVIASESSHSRLLGTPKVDLFALSLNYYSDLVDIAGCWP